MPLFLLFFAFLILRKCLKKIFTLKDFFISVCMKNCSKILHELEISSHCISQTSELAKFRNESNLISCFAIFMDKKRLVHIRNVFIISCFVIFSIAHLSSLLIESGLRSQSEVYSFNFVSFLVVSK